MATRSSRLRDRARLVLGMSKTGGVQDRLLYEIMTEASRKIAEDFLCIERSDTLVFDENGVATEPAGFFRMKQITLPTSQIVFPIEVSVTQYEAMTRIYPTTLQPPYFYKRWAGEITFFPNPGATTRTVLYYAVPLDTLSVDIDPETPEGYDTLLYYGMLKDVLAILGRPEQVASFLQLYGVEYKRLKDAQVSSNTITRDIVYYDV